MCVPSLLFVDVYTNPGRCSDEVVPAWTVRAAQRRRLLQANLAADDATCIPWPLPELHGTQMQEGTQAIASGVLPLRPSVPCGSVQRERSDRQFLSLFPPRPVKYCEARGARCTLGNTRRQHLGGRKDNPSVVGSAAPTTPGTTDAPAEKPRLGPTALCDAQCLMAWLRRMHGDSEW